MLEKCLTGEVPAEQVDVVVAGAYVVPEGRLVPLTWVLGVLGRQDMLLSGVLCVSFTWSSCGC